MSDGRARTRRRAVGLAAAGWTLQQIAEELGCSRESVRRWLARFAAEGDAGLVDRSRRPRSSPGRLPKAVVDEVVEVRRLLTEDRHASRGPVAIIAAIERRGVITAVPSIASVKRILSRHGLTRSYRKRDRNSERRLGLPQVTMPGIWQQADWVQDRWLTGGIRFSSLQISDVGSHMLSCGQHLNRRLITAVRQLTTHAWPKLSIPYAMGFDNAFSKTTHPDNPWTSWVRILLAFGVEALISPPNTLGYTNHIEAVNRLWQERTISRHHYNSLNELRNDSAQFEYWANTNRPVLDPTLYGTRYPAEHTAANSTKLRWLPDQFSIDDYLTADGNLHIPLTAGRATFLRHVTQHHTITIALTNWPVPTTLPIGALVVATIHTATGHLNIRYQGDIVKHYDHPTTPTDLTPYHPTATRGLLDHLPQNS
jgi:transposase